MVRGDGLLFQPADKATTAQNPSGQPVEVKPLPTEMRNGVAYFLDCIRNDKAIEGPVSARVNVAVNEILDAAIESVRTGRTVKLPAR
jgi:predicted dehydrogenase